MTAVGKKLLATRLESLRNRFAECATRFRADCLMIQQTRELPITREENDALVAKFRNERPKERATDWYGVGGRRFEIDGGWLRRALTLVGPAQLSDLRALGHDASGLMVEAGICPAPSWFTPIEVWAESGDNLWWYTLFEWSLSRPKFGDTKPRLLVAGNWLELQLNCLKGDWPPLPPIPSLRVSVNNVAQASCELLREIIDVGFPAIRSEIQKRNGKPRRLATSTVDQWCAFDADETTPAAITSPPVTEAADGGGKAGDGINSTPALKTEVPAKAETPNLPHEWKLAYASFDYARAKTQNTDLEVKESYDFWIDPERGLADEDRGRFPELIGYDPGKFTSYKTILSKARNHPLIDDACYGGAGKGKRNEVLVDPQSLDSITPSVKSARRTV